MSHKAKSNHLSKVMYSYNYIYFFVFAKPANQIVSRIGIDFSTQCINT